MGLRHYLVGENKKAVQNLERAIQYAPNNAALYSALGEAYLQLGQKEKALIGR